MQLRSASFRTAWREKDTSTSRGVGPSLLHTRAHTHTYTQTDRHTHTYLEVTTADQKVHCHAFPLPYLHQSLIDPVQLTMATTLYCNLQSIHSNRHVASLPPKPKGECIWVASRTSCAHVCRVIATQYGHYTCFNSTVLNSYYM